MKEINPTDIAQPQSNYCHGVETSGAARRLAISGQVAARPDGSTPEGLRAQLELCWDNVFAVCRAAGMEPRNLVRATVYVTVPGSAALHREVRDAKLGGHRLANTYLEVSGLAAEKFLCEIEAEAAAG